MVATLPDFGNDRWIEVPWKRFLRVDGWLPPDRRYGPRRPYTNQGGNGNQLCVLPESPIGHKSNEARSQQQHRAGFGDSGRGNPVKHRPIGARRRCAEQQRRCGCRRGEGKTPLRIEHIGIGIPSRAVGEGGGGRVDQTAIDEHVKGLRVRQSCRVPRVIEGYKDGLPRGGGEVL